jgi:hypothetical protein
MSLTVSLQVGKGERISPQSAPDFLHFQLFSNEIGCSSEELKNITKVFLSGCYYRLDQCDNTVDTFPKAKGLKYRVRLESTRDLLNNLAELKYTHLEDGILTFPKMETSMTLDKLCDLKALTKEDVKACKGCFLGEG